MASPTETTTYTFYNNQAERYANDLDAYIYFFPLHISEPNTDKLDRSDPMQHSAYFKAYVNDFDENFASSWDAQQYYGKTDPIVGFKHTKRTIALSWKIPSINAQDAKHNWTMLNNLALMLYPEYMSGKAIAKNYGLGIRSLYDPLPPTAMRAPSREDMLRRIATQPSSLPLGKPPIIGVKWGTLISNRDGHNYINKRAHLRELNKSLVCHVDNFSMSPVFEMGFFTSPMNLEYSQRALYPKV